MAIDLNTLLNDTTRFPDSFEFEVSGERISLGAVRTEARRQAEAIERERQALTNERNSVKTLAEQAADLFAKAQQAAQNQPVTTPTAASSEVDYDTDPFLGPVVKKMRGEYSPLKDELKAAMDKIKAQESMLTQAAAIFSADRWEREYERGRDKLRGDKYKDWRGEGSANKLAQYAADHKLLDSFGLPSVSRAIAEITREDELEAARNQAREEGRKEAMQQARMASMPRPTSASGGKSGAPKKGLDPGANFEDLGDAVAEDAELMNMLSQIGVGGTQDIQ